MNKFAQLPEEMHAALATNAGIMLSDFDPFAVGEAAAVRQAILFATSGGVTVSCVPTFSDFGADVDNCPPNTKEMLRVDSWSCTASGTAVTLTSDNAVSFLANADRTTADGVDTIQPRFDVKNSDFKTLWYVCPYGTSGGFVAVKLDNAINTGGFSIKSENRGKGKFDFTYTGYSSIDNPHVVPFTFYLKASSEEETQQVEPNV